MATVASSVYGPSPLKGERPQALSTCERGGPWAVADAIGSVRGVSATGRQWLTSYLPAVLLSGLLHLAVWLGVRMTPDPVAVARPWPVVEVSLVAGVPSRPQLSEPPPAPKEVQQEPLVDRPEARPPEKRAARLLRRPKPEPKSPVAPRPATVVAGGRPGPAPRAVALPADTPAEPVTEASFDADYLHNPKPAYPAIAKRHGWEGRVLLRVRVLADGTGESIEVQRGSGHGVLDESARQAVERWRFVPAKRGDGAVASWVTVPIVFRLDT